MVQFKNLEFEARSAIFELLAVISNNLETVDENQDYIQEVDSQVFNKRYKLKLQK